MQVVLSYLAWYLSSVFLAGQFPIARSNLGPRNQPHVARQHYLLLCNNSTLHRHMMKYCWCYNTIIMFFHIQRAGRCFQLIVHQCSNLLGENMLEVALFLAVNMQSGR